jgi:hypothetical protein
MSVVAYEFVAALFVILIEFARETARSGQEKEK